MTDSKSNPQPSVTDEAADWYARLRAPDVTELDAVRFRAWIARDPANRREFDETDHFWDALSAIDNSPEVTRARSHLADLRAIPTADQWQRSISLFRFGRGRRWARLAIAASTVTALAGIAWMQNRPADHYTTDIGEQRTVPLTDGSVVTLNTATEIRLRYSDNKRRIELISGQANFEVAKDPKRPFTVTAGGREVRALGTQFDVYKTGEKITVTLIEGKVAVSNLNTPLPATGEGGARDYGRVRETQDERSESSSTAKLRQEMRTTRDGTKGEGPQGIILTPGQRITFLYPSTGDGRGVRGEGLIDTPRIAAVSAWRTRKLDFDNTPLTDAIAEANRYSQVKIQLDAPELTNARISGTFEAGKNALIAEGLQTYYHLNITHTDDDRIVLTPQ